MTKHPCDELERDTFFAAEIMRCAIKIRQWYEILVRSIYDSQTKSPPMRMTTGFRRIIPTRTAGTPTL